MRGNEKPSAILRLSSRARLRNCYGRRRRFAGLRHFDARRIWTVAIHYPSPQLRAVMSPQALGEQPTVVYYLKHRFPVTQINDLQSESLEKVVRRARAKCRRTGIGPADRHYRIR